MSIQSVFKADSHSLSSLMNLEEDTQPLWRPDELAAIWRHQLSAPLEFDLSTIGPDAETTLHELESKQPKRPKTFRELLQDPHPPIELLKLAKDFAKTHANSTDGALPQEIATALYYAAISTALVHCNQRITSLTDDQLRKGLSWCMTQPWLDEASRSLAQQALADLPAA